MSKQHPQIYSEFGTDMTPEKKLLENVPDVFYILMFLVRVDHRVQYQLKPCSFVKNMF